MSFVLRFKRAEFIISNFFGDVAGRVFDRISFLVDVGVVLINPLSSFDRSAGIGVVERSGSTIEGVLSPDIVGVGSEGGGVGVFVVSCA